MAQTSDLTYYLRGYWANSESFCERALRYVPEERFTEKALALCSRLLADKNASATRLPSADDLREVRSRARRHAMIGWSLFSLPILILAYIVLTRNYITGLLGDLCGTAMAMAMIFGFVIGAGASWTLLKTRKLLRESSRIRG